MTGGGWTGTSVDREVGGGHGRDSKWASEHGGDGITRWLGKSG